MRATIESGNLQGFIDGETAAYLGIPYAAGPIGNLRFQPPIAPDSWSGVRDSRFYRDAPVQATAFANGGSKIGSEDCLYLNLWASLSQTVKKPTLVWVYGGGFEGGSAASDEFNGSEIAAAADSIFVNFNYRVGFLGFGALQESTEFPASTNLGFRDLIALLEWVQLNIEAFGGDPRNVAVIGQSAGAFITSGLLSSERYTHLYDRVFLMSGGASRFIPLERTLTLTAEALTSLGDDLSPQDAPIDSLLAAQRNLIPSDMGIRNGMVPQALGMTLDGTSSRAAIPSHPLDEVITGHLKGKQILVSCDEREVFLFRKYLPQTFACESLSELAMQLQTWGIPKEKCDALVNHYASAAPECSPPELRELILTDYIYRLPAARLLEAQAAAGGECWGIEFVGTEGAPMGHGDELPSLFWGTAELRKVNPDPQLKQDLLSTVVRFARDGVADWPAYTGDASQIRLMGASNGIRTNFYEQLLRVWAGIERP